MHWIRAAFGGCCSLESKYKSVNMFQNVKEFHIQNFDGFRAKTTCTVHFFGNFKQI